MNRTALLSTSIASVALFGSALLVAGPLDPPPGAVASSYKTLTEVEPRTAINAANTPGDATAAYILSTPGSYYLTSNLNIPGGKFGLRVAASGVSIDLNGFAITGENSLGSAGGITDAGVAWAGVTIHDGFIQRTNGRGIDLAASSRCVVRNVTVGDNLGSGVLVGADSTLDAVVCSSNGVLTPSPVGMSVGNRSTIVRCRSTSNLGNGITTGAACRVIESASFASGAHGISTGDGATIASCTADSNSQSGFLLLSVSTITGSTARGNVGNGIEAGVGCSVTQCTVRQNASAGILALDSGIVGGCTATGNGSIGIDARQSCIVTECTSNANASHGISLGLGSTVARSVADQNVQDGIITAGACIVRDNNCRSNGALGGSGAGIHITGLDSDIRGNTCSNNDRGIDVTGPGNLIVANTCAGNASDWQVAANNINGPILDRRTPGTPAFGGFFSVGSMGSDDPNANYSY